MVGESHLTGRLEQQNTGLLRNAFLRQFDFLCDNRSRACPDFFIDGSASFDTILGMRTLWRSQHIDRVQNIHQLVTASKEAHDERIRENLG